MGEELPVFGGGGLHPRLRLHQALSIRGQLEGGAVHLRHHRLPTPQTSHRLLPPIDAPPCTMVENREKHRQNKPSNHSLSHERGSERSERASERVSAAEGASKVSSPEEANERTDERVAQYFSLYPWLISTIVYVWNLTVTKSKKKIKTIGMKQDRRGCRSKEYERETENEREKERKRERECR